MDAVDQSELQALRRRAYGPDADIHLDSRALQRLHELEREGKPRAEVVPEPIDDELVQHPVPAPSVQPPFDDDEEPKEHPAQKWVRRFILVARRIRQLRRSTVLTALGVAVLVTAVVVSLTLVQRVQSDPLQAGATQVARLSADPGYAMPPFFAGVEEGRAQGVQAYDEFYGLRVVLTTGGVFDFGASADAQCLNIASSAVLEASTENSFGGRLWQGCTAGEFPAIIQFSSDIPDLPDELHLAFPDSTGLQFVYDGEDNEVVVFADR